MRFGSRRRVQRAMALWVIVSHVCGLVPLGLAAPNGGTVVAGSAAIDASQPGVTRITQSTDRAIVNWQGFSTAAGESVQFAQPHGQAVTLNRVTGAGASQLDGSLTANGRVFILNPNGIVFGAGSQVNVGGLVASTLSMKDSDFMAGRYELTQDGSKPLAAVVNKGSIRTAPGGKAALIAPVVSNEGTIEAPGGEAAIAAGTHAVVNLDGAGLVNLDTPAAGHGDVQLPAGAASQALRDVVNNRGIVEAGRVSCVNGVVTLSGAEGVAVNSGRISVDAAAGQAAGGRASVTGTAAAVVAGEVTARGAARGQKGGLVHVAGRVTGVRGAGRLDASGDAGGGTVIAGNDPLDTAPQQTVTRVVVENGAVLAADATRAGNGGRVAAKADTLARSAGVLSAQGGSESGDGGLIETSASKVDVTGAQRLGAPHGKGGTWLIDPDVVTIVNGGSCVNVTASAPGSNPYSFTGGACASCVSAASIVAAFNGGASQVIVQTSSAPGADIVSTCCVSLSGFTGLHTLTLKASHSIVLNGGFSIDSCSQLNVDLQANRSGTGGIVCIGSISTNGGFFHSSGTVFCGVCINTQGGNICVNHTGLVKASGFDTSRFCCVYPGQVKVRGTSLCVGNIRAGTGGVCVDTGAGDIAANFVSTVRTAAGVNDGNIVLRGRNIVLDGGVDTQGGNATLVATPVAGVGGDVSVRIVCMANHPEVGPTFRGGNFVSSGRNFCSVANGGGCAAICLGGGSFTLNHTGTVTHSGRTCASRGNCLGSLAVNGAANVNWSGNTCLGGGALSFNNVGNVNVAFGCGLRNGRFSSTGSGSFNLCGTVCTTGTLTVNHAGNVRLSSFSSRIEADAGISVTSRNGTVCTGQQLLYTFGSLTVFAGAGDLVLGPTCACGSTTLTAANGRIVGPGFGLVASSLKHPDAAAPGCCLGKCGPSPLISSAGPLVMAAALGIGGKCGSPLLFSAPSVTAKSSSGGVDLVSCGPTRVCGGTGGGDFRLRAMAPGDIAVGLVQATGTVTLQAQSGSLTDANGSALNVSASNAMLVGSYVGSTSTPLGVRASTVAALANNDIGLALCGTSRITQATASCGSLAIRSTGGCIVLGGPLFAAKTLALEAPNGNILSNGAGALVQSTGQVSLLAGGIVGNSALPIQVDVSGRVSVGARTAVNDISAVLSGTIEAAAPNVVSIGSVGRVIFNGADSAVRASSVLRLVQIDFNLAVALYGPEIAQLALNAIQARDKTAARRLLSIAPGIVGGTGIATAEIGPLAEREFAALFPAPPAPVVAPPAPAVVVAPPPPPPPPPPAQVIVPVTTGLVFAGSGLGGLGFGGLAPSNSASLFAAPSYSTGSDSPVISGGGSASIGGGFSPSGVGAGGSGFGGFSSFGGFGAGSGFGGIGGFGGFGSGVSFGGFGGVTSGVSFGGSGGSFGSFGGSFGSFGGSFGGSSGLPGYSGFSGGFSGGVSGGISDVTGGTTGGGQMLSLLTVPSPLLSGSLVH